jgi:Na+-transporting methylmalonyl-CoA/oxaloacetate decarboxylase gamma subunit
MKLAATIFLFLFSLVQVVPAVTTFFSDSSIIFLVDEEKSAEKSETEKKDKKEYAFEYLLSEILSQKMHTAIHLAEKIHPSPLLEKPTPPPNF